LGEDTGRQRFLCTSNFSIGVQNPRIHSEVPDAAQSGWPNSDE